MTDHDDHDGVGRALDSALLDVDGTLVDSTYQHALAWHRAFAKHDLSIPMWRLHRAIGMGGDRLVPEVAGDDVESRLGDDLRAAEKKEYDGLHPEVRAFDRARALLAELHDRGWRAALASRPPRRSGGTASPYVRAASESWN